MENNKIRCFRCHGRKQIYKMMSGYSHANSGGPLVDCPMCLGEGKVKTLESAIADSAIADSVIKRTKSKKQKDLKNEQEITN